MFGRWTSLALKIIRQRAPEAFGQLRMSGRRQETNDLEVNFRLTGSARD
jgi:hypothetical protein